MVLSVLSVFGVEITPLLAGAGVVGIAVGFGAQTLVRDILSGVFYLIEDVFRIGDYIEGGSSAKGTVERITLRTVALRHQNGPLHFVPYGVLGAVRNNSRDWVIDKFELPLPVDVDSEFVRKTVKKIGQQMLEDPALAAVIVEPLKAKLYKIQPGAKIFRCKIQTPPGKQFEVRGEAYKRIEAALKAAGIQYADTNTRIVMQGRRSAGWRRAEGGGVAHAEPTFPEPRSGLRTRLLSQGRVPDRLRAPGREASPFPGTAQRGVRRPSLLLHAFASLGPGLGLRPPRERGNGWSASLSGGRMASPSATGATSTSTSRCWPDESVTTPETGRRRRSRGRPRGRRGPPRRRRRWWGRGRSSRRPGRTRRRPRRGSRPRRRGARGRAAGGCGGSR